MLGLHIPRSERDAGYTELVPAAGSALRFLDFGLITLDGAGYKRALQNREAVLLLLDGQASVTVADHRYDLGPRRSVFDELPWLLYLPPGSEFTAQGAGTLAFASTPAGGDYPVTLVEPQQVITRRVGAQNWSRDVRAVLDERFPAERLLVGETVNPPGNWSSYPPHKHDTANPPFEMPLEELYYFSVEPAGGFGFQRLYTPPDVAAPFDVTYTVGEGDTVLIPRGYHPVVAAPGYRLYYLWILAGEARAYGAWSDDSTHSWVRRLEHGL